ncbi:permease prefix domain 1-containing protein [Actinoalloteichus hymeniacidonis]|nr:permease prefix domain 1-containing protein [Actinoalloteichus hymeniacidonis]MBB5910246.1 hypothetical protein [Actinoalloteichus hymeniacidonis]
MIEDYLVALNRRLSGPGSVKSELLAEIRHSLDDAAEAYRDGGFSEADAQHRAVVEFGRVELVAEECQAELAVSHGLGTVRTLLAATVLLVALWECGRRLITGHWSGAVTAAQDTPLAGLAFGAAALSGIVLAVIVLAVLLVVRVMSRRISPRVLSTMLTRFNMVAILSYGTTLFLVCGLGMYYRPEAFHDAGMVIVMSVTSLVMSRLGWLAMQSLRL